MQARSRLEARDSKIQVIKIDGFVKSRKNLISVIPAKAGIQVLRALAEYLDPGSCPPMAGSPG
jgi:hypothetical protein